MIGQFNNTERIFFSLSLSVSPLPLHRHAFCYTGYTRPGYQLAEIPGNHLRDRAAKCSSLGWPLIGVIERHFRDDRTTLRLVAGTPSIRVYHRRRGGLRFDGTIFLVARSLASKPIVCRSVLYDFIITRVE